MRNLITTFIIFVFVLSGCGKDESKEQYYQKGVQYIESGNYNGAVISLKKAIEKDENYFEARYQLGRAFNEQGKYDSAEKELLKALKLNPSFQEAHVALAKAYIYSRKIDEAAKEITTYLTGTTNNPEAYEIASAVYVGKRDLAAAEEYLHKALEVSPGRASSKIFLSEIYLSTGKKAEAEAQVKEVISADSKNKKAFYMYAKIKQSQGRMEESIDMYRKVLSIDPKDITAAFEMGLAYLDVKKIDKAREVLDNMDKNHKGRPEVPYLRGLIFFNERKLDEAIGSLQETVKKAGIPGAYYYLGLCNLDKGNYEQATSEFQKVIDISPDMTQARLLLAVTHLKKGRAEDAKREARRVLETDEKNAFAYNVLGSAYLALNQGDMAMEAFDKAIELNPQLAEAHIKKGAFNLLSGESQKAEKEFIDAVEVAPEILDSRIILAKYYIRNKRYQDALKTLNAGLKGNATDAVLYNIIGAAYLGAGDNEKARQSFEKAKSSDPKFFMPYFNIATIYRYKGEKDKAMQEYKKVLDIDSVNIVALLALANMMESEKKDKEALSYYTKAAEQKKPMPYLALAGYYQRKNDTEQAIKVLQDALQTDPNNVQAKEMMGLLQAVAKDYKGSIETYQEIEKTSPEAGKAGLANTYKAMGDYDKAITELKKLLSITDKKPEVLREIVNLYILKKDYASAERTAREIISQLPTSEAGYQILASVYLENDKFQDSIDALKKAQELRPDNAAVRLEIGKVYIAARDFQKASGIFNDMLKSNPRYAPAYFYLASIHELKGEKKEAVVKYQKVLELSAGYVPALNNLAYLYAEGFGSVDKAVELARKAKELAPGDGGVTDTLGWTLYKTGNYDEALKYLIEATHYLPGEPAVRYHLGLTYLKKGMNDKAEEQLQNSVRLGREKPFSEGDEVRKILADMKR